MKAFYQLLGNSLIANITNFFVWSSVIYWAYLETGSVIVTSISSGIYLVLTAGCGFLFGTIVDHTKKKAAMLISSMATFAFFIAALAAYLFAPDAVFESPTDPHLWSVIVLLLLGVIAGNIRMIAMPTAVTLLVPEDKRDRANGMTGMVFGASFAVSNVAAGVGLGYLGMGWVLFIGAATTLLAMLHLLFIKVPEPDRPVETADESKKGRIDIRGTIAAVRSVPGLFPLILFTTFNNFLGGIFMSLMDAYGLSLVSVQTWGTLWGFLSFGFIVSGLYIAKKGLGKNPVNVLFSINIFTWSICIVMALQPSIVLLAVCMFAYLCAAPFIEASEQTIIQKVVPHERQGRVFGFAQSVEQAASPIMAFMIGPIAQLLFIPFMTTGAGVTLIGDWYGVGPGRGIALVFTCAGVIGAIVTIIARRSRSAKALTKRYQEG